MQLERKRGRSKTEILQIGADEHRTEYRTHVQCSLEIIHGDRSYSHNLSLHWSAIVLPKLHSIGYLMKLLGLTLPSCLVFSCPYLQADGAYLLGSMQASHYLGT